MAEKRKVKVDWSALEEGFEFGSWEVSYYLDLRTGKVLLITEDTRSKMNDIEESLPDASPEELTEHIQQLDLEEWERDELLGLMAVDEGFNEDVIEIPKQDSQSGYQEMEDFIATVKDGHLREKLVIAIQGKGAFRRFKDTVARYPAEEERWFEFKRQQLHERIKEWLEDEGIELV